MKDGDADVATEEAEELCQWHEWSSVTFRTKGTERSERDDETSGRHSGLSWERRSDALTH